MKKFLVLATIAAAAVVLVKKAKASSETKETWHQVADQVS
ncbi:DLW-39 family protein [Glutamicibacter halophytocola]|nr:DLW-39 family protein [Glutamicibacter halophytocola]